MPTPTHRPRVLLLPLAVVLAFTPAHGQAAGGWSGCKTDALSNYNCATYYSGTVTLTSELKTPRGTESRSVVATVTAGKVMCRVKDPSGDTFEGAGLLVAEHASTGPSGSYSVKVWCPREKGQAASRDDAPMIDTYDQEAGDYATLSGKNTHDHPDTDPANGVSGTETVVWQLHR